VFFVFNYHLKRILVLLLPICHIRSADHSFEGTVVFIHAHVVVHHCVLDFANTFAVHCVVLGDAEPLVLNLAGTIFFVVVLVIVGELALSIVEELRRSGHSFLSVLIFLFLALLLLPLSGVGLFDLLLLFGELGKCLSLLVDVGLVLPVVPVARVLST